MKVIRFLSRFIPTMLVGITILYLSLSHVTSPYNVPNIQNLDKIVHFTMYMGLVPFFASTCIVPVGFHAMMVLYCYRDGYLPFYGVV